MGAHHRADEVAWPCHDNASGTAAGPVLSLARCLGVVSIVWQGTSPADGGGRGAASSVAADRPVLPVVGQAVSRLSQGGRGPLAAPARAARPRRRGVPD